MTDSYTTIQGVASSEYEEKKSRFIAQVAHVQTEEEALEVLEAVRSANPLARHNVYAYTLRQNNRTRYSDDGEPAKTAGLPTLSVIEHEDLKDVICVTTRYFGGTLLGTGGLVRAYTKAAQDAFAVARKVIFAECVDLTVEFDYSLYDTLLHWANQQNIQIVESNFSNNVSVILRLRLSQAEIVMQTLRELTRGQAHLQMGVPSFQLSEC